MHDDDSESAPPHIEVLSCRLLLSADADDDDTYALAVLDTLSCEHCAVRVMGSLVSTVIWLLHDADERNWDDGPPWQDRVADRLATVLDAADHSN